ncbi:hypothetical protein [Sphaerisporangium dianthi]|uniref:Uncharacterized protein n=1 Tax=Sphaerisporangium dianthi TaxID=1436120 RepID=A0ABV9CM91_9ACTN
MSDVDEVSALLRPLARVAPGRRGDGASGAGARTLLASVTAQRPDAALARPSVGRRRHGVFGPRRVAMGMAAAAVLATGVVVGPSLLRDGGGVALGYANSAVEIVREGDQYVARIKDPFAEHALYTEAFKAVGLRVGLRPVPVSPGGVGKILGMVVTAGGAPEPRVAPDPSGPRIDGVLLTMETSPQGCDPGRDDGCVMVMRVPARFRGVVDVRLGRQARPGEEYADFDRAMAPGGMFDGVHLREGRPVAEVRAEARRRDLAVVFSLIRVDPKSGGLSFEPLPAGRVGRGWTVWNAWQVKAGVIRLLVTPGRLAGNPFHNGSAPPPSPG